MGLYRRLMVAKLFAAVAIVGLAYAPDAMADDADSKFLAAVSAAGVPGDAGQFVPDGHAACDNYGTPGMTGQMLAIEARGLTPQQASAVMIAGIHAYCPDKAPI